MDKGPARDDGISQMQPPWCLLRRLLLGTSRDCHAPSFTFVSTLGCVGGAEGSLVKYTPSIEYIYRFVSPPLKSQVTRASSQTSNTITTIEHANKHSQASKPSSTTYSYFKLLYHNNSHDVFVLQHYHQLRLIKRRIPFKQLHRPYTIWKCHCRTNQLFNCRQLSRRIHVQQLQ